MPKPLTPNAIAKLKSRAQRYETPDGGCTGLYVTVYPSKKKTFVVRFRFKGLSRKLTLGPVLVERDVVESGATPETGTPLSLAAARELCTRALREAKAGTDPCAEKQKKRQQELAAESDALLAISEQYFRLEGPRLRTVGQRKADLKLVTDVLGRLPVADIKRSQFTHALDHIAKNNGPVRADRVLSALRTLLKWHATRSDYVSPLVPGRRYSASIKDRARDRVLSDHELRAIWGAAEKDKLFGAYVQFLLLTTTRRGEAAGLRRSELSEGGTLWVIPRTRYKSNRDHVVPLSKAAQAIIASMPDRGEHVFGGARPLAGFNDRKKAFDAACRVEGWTLHDLRRTSRTLMSRAGVAPDHAERCLGHVIGGVRETYDRYKYREEKARAFAALATMIERIVHPPTGVVVMLKKGRKKEHTAPNPWQQLVAADSRDTMREE